MLLLDTHVLIWLVDDNPRLGAGARELIGAVHPVHYSSVSVLEITIKAMLGRLSVPADLSAVLDGEGLRQLPFVAEHSEELTDFPELVGHDPFDRALLAQAASESLQFLTSDRRLLALDRPWVVDAED